MRLNDLPKIPEKQLDEAVVTLEEEAITISDDELAAIAGVTRGAPDYEQKINDLKRMRKYNPRLFNKIANYD